MTRDEAERLARELYRALAQGDRVQLSTLLHPDFVGHTTEGLPGGLGGTYEGPEAMRRRFWGGIARSFDATAEPKEVNLLDDGRLLVRGRYTGAARGGGPLDAEFAHVLSFADGRIVGLDQLTDSARWQAALPVTLSTVELRVAGGVAHVRLNRPAARNAIDETLAAELCEVAQRLASAPEPRALLVTGNGPAFTVGGDVTVFGRAGTGELPGLLRRMTTPYHDALRMLAELDVPVVAAVHGAVAGGGLGLLYVADVAVAAEDTTFATGFGALGLSGDGGGTWFLPRLVGPRRAAELYLRGRRLDARTAMDWGLVSEIVPAAELESRARAIAEDLASGPTQAYAHMRRLLRQSWTATLAEQLAAETDALARSAATADAEAAVASFLARTTPTFRGR